MSDPTFGQDHLDGLEMPAIAEWPIFPFEGDMRVRTVVPFEAQDFARDGEAGKPCHCEKDTEDRWQPIWGDERWEVRPIQFRAGVDAPVPAYMLGTVEHMDLIDFDDEYAADLGVITLRLTRAIRSIGSIGRVHINRWGDGGAHFHMWFIGRPLGAWQLSGFSMPLWCHVLPPLTAEVLAANHDAVRGSLDASAPAKA